MSRLLRVSLGLVTALLAIPYALVVTQEALLVQPQFSAGCLSTIDREPRVVYVIAGPAIESICRRRFLETAKAHGAWFQPNTAVGVIVASYPKIDLDTTSELLKSLKASGADISEYDGIGLTPLHAAALFNQPDMVELLLGLGANPDLPRRQVPGQRQHPTVGLTALQYAEWLRDHGKSDEVRDPRIVEILHRARIVHGGLTGQGRR